MTAISNVTNPSNVANVAKTVAPSDDVRNKMLAALAMLFPLVAEIDPKLPKLPEFSKCGDEEYKMICVRTLKALVAHTEHMKVLVVQQFRGKCEAVIEAHMTLARAARTEYATLSPTLKALLPAFKDTVEIPISAFASVFPATYTTQEVCEKLLAFNYKGNGAERGRLAGKHTAIVVPYVAAAPTPAPVVVVSPLESLQSGNVMTVNAHVSSDPETLAVLESLAAADNVGNNASAE